MPEGRMLKRRISDSKKLGALKTDSARLLYTWLIPWLDVEGRYTADPDLIKGRIFPKVKSFTPAKIEIYLKELREIGLILLYKSDGETYLQLKKFHTEQKINREREAETKIPPPPQGSGLNHENSGLNHENSNTNKVKEKEIKESLSLNKNVPNSIDIELTQLLMDKILENDPKSKVQKMTEKQQLSWIDDCRKLRERDERTPAEIRAIIKWCQKDSFWKANIQSMGKLREKFGQLYVKAKSSTGGSDFSGIEDWLRKQGEIE